MLIRSGVADTGEADGTAWLELTWGKKESGWDDSRSGTVSGASTGRSNETPFCILVVIGHKRRD